MGQQFELSSAVQFCWSYVVTHVTVVIGGWARPRCSKMIWLSSLTVGAGCEPSLCVYELPHLAVSGQWWKQVHCTSASSASANVRFSNVALVKSSLYNLGCFPTTTSLVLWHQLDSYSLIQLNSVTDYWALASDPKKAQFHKSASTLVSNC